MPKWARCCFSNAPIKGAFGRGDTTAEERSNGAACAATLARYDRRLARALAQVVNILDPDVIVLGGGLSNMARLYTNVPKLWSQYIFSDQVHTQLRRHQHGDSSGVRGAAWLWNGD